MPKQLTEDQKEPRITIAQEHFGRFNQDENKVFNFIVTGDEIWAHYADPETKAQSKLRKRVGSPLPNKFKLSPSAEKFMRFAFWYSRGIKLAQFI